jgi:hypothetical protein
MCNSFKSLIDQYLYKKEIELVSFNWFENTQSFQAVGLINDGDGCYVILFGEIRNNQVFNTRFQFFKELNRYNIEENCGFLKK